MGGLTGPPVKGQWWFLREAGSSSKFAVRKLTGARVLTTRKLLSVEDGGLGRGSWKSEWSEAHWGAPNEKRPFQAPKTVYPFTASPIPPSQSCITPGPETVVGETSPPSTLHLQPPTPSPTPGQTNSPGFCKLGLPIRPPQKRLRGNFRTDEPLKVATTTTTHFKHHIVTTLDHHFIFPLQGQTPQTLPPLPRPYQTPPKPLNANEGGIPQKTAVTLPFGLYKIYFECPLGLPKPQTLQHSGPFPRGPTGKTEAFGGWENALKPRRPSPKKPPREGRLQNLPFDPLGKPPGAFLPKKTPGKGWQPLAFFSPKNLDGPQAPPFDCTKGSPFCPRVKRGTGILLPSSPLNHISKAPTQAKPFKFDTQDAPAGCRIYRSSTEKVPDIPKPPWGTLSQRHFDKIST
ncbi:extensin-like [Penaeus monodon]|uniref:extensin-like n=1 Tax=Penaeus monodon TaxID=6687 RepID=UPI0018A7A8C5|nr:extensin-like [Penaeus monodon]